MLNVDALLAVLESVKENGIAELKISNDLVEIRTYASASVQPSAMAAPVIIEQAAAPAPVKTAEPITTAAEETKVEAPAPVAAVKAEDIEASGNMEIVEAPIPGTVFVSPAKDLNGTPLPGIGQKVEKGQVIALLEAMKMFNEIFSPVSGIVRDIKVNSETSISPGDVIMTIELL